MVMVDIRNENNQIKNIFLNKDLVSIDELLSKIEELDDDRKYIKQEFEEYKEYVEEYYKQKTGYEIYGINEKDFYNKE